MQGLHSKLHTVYDVQNIILYNKICNIQISFNVLTKILTTPVNRLIDTANEGSLTLQKLVGPVERASQAIDHPPFPSLCPEHPLSNPRTRVHFHLPTPQTPQSMVLKETVIRPTSKTHPSHPTTTAPVFRIPQIHSR